MAKPVLLTPIAKSDLENISDWLANEWNLKILENFLSLYDAKLQIIAEHPTRYPFIHKPSKLRKAVLTKRCIILYREMEDHIEIISLFDTRQSPERIERLTKPK